MGMHIHIVIELLLTTYSRIHTQMAMTKETLACMLNKKVAKSNAYRNRTGCTARVGSCTKLLAGVVWAEPKPNRIGAGCWCGCRPALVADPRG